MIQRLGKLGAPSASGSLCWELLLGTEQCQPGEWEAGNMKLSFRHFSCGYSQVLCSTVLLKFLQWALEISQSYFHSRIIVYCCSLWGEGDGMQGGPTPHLGEITQHHSFLTILSSSNYGSIQELLLPKASLLPSLP